MIFTYLYILRYIVYLAVVCVGIWFFNTLDTGMLRTSCEFSFSFATLSPHRTLISPSPCLCSSHFRLLLLLFCISQMQKSPINLSTWEFCYICFHFRHCRCVYGFFFCRLLLLIAASSIYQNKLYTYACTECHWQCYSH